MPAETADIARMLEALFPAWSKMTDGERAQMAASTTPRHYAAGEHVHSGDIDCVGVVVVARGTLRVYFLSEEGREITLFRVQRGQTCLLSASCVLPLITFDVFIDAQIDADVLIVSTACFNGLMEANPNIEAFAYRQIAERFSEVMWVMQQVLFISFDKRLATYLMDESSYQNSLTLTITHDRIARDLGSAREVVSRMLKYFEREGLVKLDRGTVTIKDRQRLCGIAQ